MEIQRAPPHLLLHTNSGPHAGVEIQRAPPHLLLHTAPNMQYNARKAQVILEIYGRAFRAAGLSG